MDFSNLLYGYVKVVLCFLALCETKSSWSLTKISKLLKLLLWYKVVEWVKVLNVPLTMFRRRMLLKEKVFLNLDFWNLQNSENRPSISFSIIRYFVLFPLTINKTPEGFLLIIKYSQENKIPHSNTSSKFSLKGSCGQRKMKFAAATYWHDRFFAKAALFSFSIKISWVWRV